MGVGALNRVPSFTEFFFFIIGLALPSFTELDRFNGRYYLTWSLYKKNDKKTMNPIKGRANQQQVGALNQKYLVLPSFFFIIVLALPSFTEFSLSFDLKKEKRKKEERSRGFLKKKKKKKKKS